MAHQVETMMYTKEVPWHGLGVRVEEEQTAEKAIIAAGMNWVSELRPLYLRGVNEVDGIPVIGTEVPDVQAVVRTKDNSVLGVVKGRYHIIQNHECFSFMDSVIGSGQAVYHTAGSLKGGRVIFMTVKLPKDAKVGPDKIEKYILLSSSHDGSHSLEIRWTPVRVVCANTLGAALRQRTSDCISIRHCQNYASKVEQAREILQLTDQYYDLMEKEYNKLLDAEMNHGDMVKFAEKLFPSEDRDPSTKTKNIRNRVVELFGTGKGIAEVKNTRWAAYNAVTEYVDHWSTVKMTEKSKLGGLQEARMNNAIFGNGSNLKQKAFDLLQVA
jgi:phage/plasmid-like protein (TIGR03299 family)